MTFGEAIAKLEAYKNIHGDKLNAPWRKNPNVILSTMITQMIHMYSKRDKDDEVGPIVERRVNELVKGSPKVARTGGVHLSKDEVKRLLRGETLNREVVSGVVARIKMHKDAIEEFKTDERNQD